MYLPIKSVQRKEEIKGLSKSISRRIKLTKCFAYIKREQTYHKKCKFGFICYYIYKQPFMQFFCYFCIIINTLILMMERVNMSITERLIIEKANIVLVTIFTFEIVIALIGLGVHKYFRDAFNVWDFIVIVFSIVEIILREFTSIISKNKGSIGVIFRILRILRIFKLFPQWENFHIILESIFETVICMTDYLVLFVLVLYIYTLVGYNFFHSNSGIENEFRSFPISLLTVFYIIIGDGWSNIYIKSYTHRNTDSEKVLTIIYFITLVLIGHVTMSNIFLAYLIDNFQTAKLKLERNIKVKDFILNVMYYSTKAHEIQLKSEKKKYKERNMVTALNKVLQRMFNKKLLTE